MNTQNTVEVYLGNPIPVQSEREFLARLRRDLLERGVTGRIFANFRAGREERQIDFVVVTDYRVVQLDQKVFPGPVLHGPVNGPWTVRVGTNQVQEWRNPLVQGLDATYALSDEMHRFSAGGGVPGPSGKKFYSDIDTIVCAYPSLPAGSLVKTRAHVAVLGYDDLLERVRTPGPALPWPAEDWDAFRRHLNLYGEEEDSPEALVRHAGIAAVDAYLRLFLQAHADLPPLVPTGVNVAGVPCPRPEITDLAEAGWAVLLRGGSGCGKTLWALHGAVALAHAGHVPIWLAAEVCEASFRTAVARAVAPYTPLLASELLRAADAAGRAVVFIVDDLSKAPERVRRALVSGAQTARLRTPTHGIIITAQTALETAALPNLLDVELQVPNDRERLAVLNAYDHGEIIERCDPFTTPLELALAAECAAALPAGTTSAALLDIYIDRVLDGDEGRRDALRALALRMHEELIPSFPRPDVSRMLRRDHDLDGEALRDLLTGPLVRVTHGQVSFAHERYERFLAAEALIADPDTARLGRTLNEPPCAHLRADAIALESEETCVTELLTACEDPKILEAAATKRLGQLAEQVTDALLNEAIAVACACTTQPGIRFSVGEGPVFLGRWTMPQPLTAANEAQLTAVGWLAARGRYLDGVMRVLEHTDELCDAVLSSAQQKPPGFASHIFANTYVLGGPGGLPAQQVIRAATGHTHARRSSQEFATASGLLRGHQDLGLGALYLVAELLHSPDAPPDVLPDVIARCFAAKLYHLCLLGLEIANDCAQRLDEGQRAEVLAAVQALPTNNIMLNGMIVEALSELDGIEPARTLDDITDEIHMVLAKHEDEIAVKRARGIISSQFETDAIGPYYQAVSQLDRADRERLLVMALRGGETGLYDDWIIGEFNDLSDPIVRNAVTDHIARADPDQWYMPSDSMRGIIAGLRLLAADGQPLPDPAEGGSNDPTWRAGLTVILDAVRGREPTPGERRRAEGAWAVLTGERRDALAGFLASLHHARWLDDPPAYQLILAAMPSAAIDALTWSLQHPDQLRTAFGRTWDLRRRIVDVLAARGDRRAAQALRRFTHESDIGEAAAAAVRMIETRADT